jgi:hypothetical protein
MEFRCWFAGKLISEALIKAISLSFVHRGLQVRGINSIVHDCLVFRATLRDNLVTLGQSNRERRHRPFFTCCERWINTEGRRRGKVERWIGNSAALRGFSRNNGPKYALRGERLQKVDARQRSSFSYRYRRMCCEWKGESEKRTSLSTMRPKNARIITAQSDMSEICGRLPAAAELCARWKQRISL